jgi:hypothetical protein
MLPAAPFVLASEPVVGTTALPHLILNLILTLINWDEGRFDFTYVESMSGTYEKRPELFNTDRSTTELRWIFCLRGYGA